MNGMPHPHAMFTRPSTLIVDRFILPPQTVDTMPFGSYSLLPAPPGLVRLHLVQRDTGYALTGDTYGGPQYARGLHPSAAWLESVRQDRTFLLLVADVTTLRAMPSDRRDTWLRDRHAPAAWITV